MALDKKKRRLLSLIFVIYPFLFLVGIIDYIIGLFLPNKYEDDSLPDKNAKCSVRIDNEKAVYRSAFVTDLLRLDNPNTNLFEEFKSVITKFYNHKTMGYRERLSLDDEVQPNGKVFKKFSLGDYKWSTYEEIYDRINNISNGLLSLGLKSNQNVVLFSETRPEWLLSAFSCFKIKSPVVTLYATLGVDSLPFGINQTEAKFLITSADQLTKIQTVLNQITNVTNLIVFSDKFNMKNVDDIKSFVEKNNYKLKINTLDEVEELGKTNDLINDYERPKADDLAVIMYTSGSTGNPKGVMISHGNLIVASNSLKTRMGAVREDDVLIAYLPLAHVLELCSEILCLLSGLSIGYSSPQTMADTSTAIKKGQKGDLRLLKPTIMASVPIILERLSKAVYEKLGKSNWFKQTLFKLAFNQKLRRFRRGASTRLLDRFLFNSIKAAVLGGRVRMIISGGAILSKEVHEFAQVCFGQTIQAYGLTETCSSGTSQLPNQTENDTVGSVVPSAEIRLVDWPEAGYRSTDWPNPRGEILIGGDHISLGYYNMPEKTAEDYSYINGVRYFATGDIGEMLPNGNLKIIDRKKDLVKLSGGEYVSLNKIESLIKLLPLVDNVCVIADGTKSFCVALICPNLKQLKEIIKTELPEVNLEDQKASEKVLGNLVDALEKSERLAAKLVKELIDHCLIHKAERFEIPTRVKFVKEAWLPDTGLVTDSLKLKRKEIEKFYAKDITLLYN